MTYVQSQPNYGPEAVYQQQVVAIVHNHPIQSTYNMSTIHEPTFQDALRPSEFPGSDRDGMQKIIDDGGNPNALRYYLIGPDDVMRQYDYGSPLGQTSVDVV